MLSRSRLVNSTLLTIAVLLGVVIYQRSTISADTIRFNYSLLGFKIEVKDLEDFAKQGVSDNLNFYLKRIPPQQTQKLQQFLTQSYDVDPVLVYRYSRTSVGVKMLQRIGEIIQLPGNLNGFYGLRAAIVQTAESPTGINLIEFLKRFPTQIDLDLEELLELIGKIAETEKQTDRFIESLAKDVGEKPKFKLNIPDLSQPGRYRAIAQTRKFYDKQRDRHLNSDLYLPQGKTDTIPVIVVSNGLGAKRDRFRELATHLASYGFAVVIPDHPGSDRRRQKAFLKGLYRENFDATDFRDRPRDISFILDELERLNLTSFNNKLDLQRVGIFGYSIGGTTALALAGAEIDRQRLERQCDRPLNLLNISILYQCRASELPRSRQSLKDERIKAAFMFVPFGNSLFSQQSLQHISIPVMFQVVERDFLTSLLEEQLPLYNSLARSDRYFVISQGLPHSNVTLSNQQQLGQEKKSEVAKTYQNILSTIFFKGYIAGESSYISYLNKEYLQAIVREPYNLYLLGKK